MTIVPPICFSCKHLRPEGGYPCAAFPDGIPDEIFDGSFIHTESFPGDNGILFEAKGKLSDYARIKIAEASERNAAYREFLAEQDE